MKLTKQETLDFNRVLRTLNGLPVLRRAEDVSGSIRASLTFSERRIIAEALLPVFKEVREDADR